MCGCLGHSYFHTKPYDFGAVEPLKDSDALAALSFAPVPGRYDEGSSGFIVPVRFPHPFLFQGSLSRSPAPDARGSLAAKRITAIDCTVHALRLLLTISIAGAGFPGKCCNSGVFTLPL